jgi:PAS domain S-box-containing protein
VDARLVIDTIPTLAWASRADGSAEFFNQRWLDYTGLSAEQALDWGWKVAIHPDDLPRMLEIFQIALNVRQPFEAKGRLRRYDGEFRWFLFHANPVLDASGRVVGNRVFHREPTLSPPRLTECLGRLVQSFSKLIE